MSAKPVVRSEKVNYFAKQKKRIHGQNSLYASRGDDMLKQLLTILLLPILFLGCAPKQDIQPIELNQEFTTRLGQYHMTPDKDFIFGISKIVEDSRGSCPREKDVSCGWDGAITIQLKLTNLSKDGQTGYQEGMAHQPQYFGNYVLDIHKVRPEKPKRNHKKYRFTFELSRLNHVERMALERQQQEILQKIETGGKDQIAAIRERYENFDSDILSAADTEEIIAIEQKQAKLASEYQHKIMTWKTLEPTTRGPQPEMDPEANLANARWQELQAKVRVAQSVKSEIDRLEKLSKTHNITILDNERSELIQLYREKHMFQGDMSAALMKALISEDGQFNAAAIKDGQVSGEVIDKLPRDLLIRMSEIEQRIETIQAPFEAAEKAGKIREKMTKLSETSGVAISSDDIAETMELNAEKDRILKRTQLEAGKKWVAEGGAVSALQNSLPNAEDGARLKEIEARLKAISVPITEVK